ncbi:hypothetical protein ASD69_11690 [Lysobacter sp. Root604]|nr:hypothetical protein ASD69_11690 [Lysobacter sp. Root604]
MVYTTMSTGQLFIFAVGMLGPILFIALDEPANAKKFPGRISHVIFLVLLSAMAAGFYSLELAARNPAHKFLQILNTDFLFFASVFVAVVVLILRYLTTVYRKNISGFNVEEAMKEQANDFAGSFSARHKEQG